MADEGEHKDGQQGDPALERMGEKLSKAAGSTDVGAIKEVVQDFYRDAVDLRAKNRELARENASLKGRVKDGDVILTGDDAKAFQELAKLNIPMKDLAVKLTEGTEAAKRVAIYDQERLSDEVAEVEGRNPKVLRSIAKLHGLNFRIDQVPDPSGAKDAEGKPKKVRKAYVIPAGDKAEPVPYSDFEENNLGDFRDVLAGSDAERKDRQETPAPRILRQRAGENGGKAVSDEQVDAQVRNRHQFSV